jgi:hypothetical protein
MGSYKELFLKMQSRKHYNNLLFICVWVISKAFNIFNRLHLSGFFLSLSVVDIKCKN